MASLSIGPINPLIGRLRSAFSINITKISSFSYGKLLTFGTDFKKHLIADAVTLLGTAFIALLATAIFFGFILMAVIVINSSGFVTPVSRFGFGFGGGGVFDPGGGFADPSSCPIPGGVISLGSYNPTQEHNRSGGHGSSYYWEDVYGGSCYSIPQGSGCRTSTPPDGNRCNQPGGGASCSEYGFAADVFSSDTRVVLPQVNGVSVNWSCRYGFANGSVGNTIYCDTTSGTTSVHLVLTHVMVPSSYATDAISGTVVTALFDQGNNTHLHLEAQIDGVWVRPENYFCGG